jgi:Arc/MetJ-type ribon-helix-helix transcriptional regulator
MPRNPRTLGKDGSVAPSPSSRATGGITTGVRGTRDEAAAPRGTGPPAGTTGGLERVTVKIPRPLYRRIQILIEGSGFSSPTDFIVFVLRDLVSEKGRHPEEEPSPGELDAVRKKLQNLGYL